MSSSNSRFCRSQVQQLLLQHHSRHHRLLRPQGTATQKNIINSAFFLPFFRLRLLLAGTINTRCTAVATIGCHNNNNQ